MNNIQNSDFGFDNVTCVSMDHTVVAPLSEIRHKTLDNDIYYSASAYPYLSRNYSSKGCYIKGFYIPNASHDILVNNNKVHVNPKKKTTQLLEYQDILYSEIKQNILSIYKNHHDVVLMFSGGIDSLVIASYVKALGLMNRTTFVTVIDPTQEHFTSILNNFTYQTTINKFAKDHKAEFKDFIWLPISVDNILYCLNQLDFKHLKCHSTVSVMQRFPGQAIMSGVYGNETLLHHDYHLDEMRKQNPAITYEIHEIQRKKPPVYAWTLIEEYFLDDEYHGIEDRVLCTKPIWQLQGFNNCSIYTPLATEKLIHLSRTLDLTKLSAMFVMQVQLAKDIIKKNLGDEFNSYITHETPYDGDNIYKKFKVPIDSIDTELLTIPTNLRHSIIGYKHLLTEIKQAKENNFMSINTATVLKLMQYLSTA